VEKEKERPERRATPLGKVPTVIRPTGRIGLNDSPSYGNARNGQGGKTRAIVGGLFRDSHDQGETLTKSQG